MLKFFQKDTNRDKVYASVEGYQLDLRPVINKAKLLHDNLDELPSWAKFVSNPKKGKGWYITLIEGMFNGKHNLYGVDIERLVESTDSELSERRVAMIFFPDNTKVENLIEVGKITENVLPGWKVVVLNGKTVVNAGQCESKVDEVINSTDKNILIISAKMAQRSFSEELIDELYLAYDKGQDGTTIQKMSRALTSNNPNKVARIFSLSFDPNRDDKLDTMVFQAALNQVEKKSKSDIREELKRVYNSIDIFSCNDKGDAVKLEVDEYVKQVLEKKGISRVMGKKYDLFSHTYEEIIAIANGNDDYYRNENKVASETGKTKEIKQKVKTITNIVKEEDKKLYDDARKVIVSIFEHSNKIMRVGKVHGQNTLKGSLKVIETNNWQSILENEYGVKYLIVKNILLKKENWLNITN